ncbi:MAG: hypothetical protein ABIJ39_05500 [Chloroflexota bacterium]
MASQIRIAALLALISLTQTTLTPIKAMRLDRAALLPAPVPAWAAAYRSPDRADLDSDGVAENLSLQDSILAIRSGGALRWQSPAEWQVAQAAFTDLNQDGVPEATLLVWRPFQPWPADNWLAVGGRIAGFHDGDERSCHLILIGWQDGRMRDLWAGSAMSTPVVSFAAADLDGDGAQELVTLEGDYAASGSTPAHTLKAWEWNGFGFRIVQAVEGHFQTSQLVQVNGQLLMYYSP